MSENLNIFGKNQEEFGSLDKNLVLRTKGKVYIRFGKKYIELLDDKGNLNVKIPKIISKIKSSEEMKSDGFYLLDENLYAFCDGKVFSLSEEEGQFINYAIKQDLTQDQINIAQNNIGLKFSSLNEASEAVNEGIVFIGDEIYYINEGSFKKLTLNEPLNSINNANLNQTPNKNNSCIAWINGTWQYSEFVTLQDLDSFRLEVGSNEGISLNEPLQTINNTEFEELPESISEEGQYNPPIAIVNINGQWQYMPVVPWDKFMECCQEVKSAIEDLKDVTKKFTVNWYTEEGVLFKTTQVSNGTSAIVPEGEPIKKHYSFVEWDYTGFPITENTDIYAKFEYVPPKIYITCNPNYVGSIGGNVKVSYYVDWAGEIITDNITVEGKYNNISFEEGNFYIENNKVNKDLNINKTSLSSLGKIIFTASFEGEQEVVSAQTILQQIPQGGIVLSSFDLMKFSLTWDNAPLFVDSDLDQLVGTKQTYIPIQDPRNENSLTLDNDVYRLGYANYKNYFPSSITSSQSIENEFKIIVRKNNTEIFNTENINVSEYPEFTCLNSIYQYMSWSGDCTYSGGEYTVINFNKIINECKAIKETNPEFNTRAILIYFQVRWYKFNGTGDFNLKFNVYKLNKDDKGLVSNFNDFDFVPEDSSVKQLGNSQQLKLNSLSFLRAYGPSELVTMNDEDHYSVILPDDVNVIYNETEEKYEIKNPEEAVKISTSNGYLNPSATLIYDTDTEEIQFLPGYYTEQDLYGKSSLDESFIWKYKNEQINQ